ncbi:MAG: LysR substrate-binding domain-containing protein [Thermoleophilia bacterium]|jgi:DNA-binding transcriptional LysR family regulator|nr:LysR substrate-binding domain-containing protein [Thermoleophilia bacterium]
MSTTLRRLECLVAVGEELSFTRAAERLYVSQPSLSAQVRALERDVGAELLERTTRRVRLTEAGASLLEDARRLLAGLDEAMARARRVADRAAGTLRVAYTASVGYQALPLILDELEAQAPELTASASRSWSTRVLDAVRTGEADLGLVREFAPSGALRGELIRREPLAVFASTRSPLARQEVLSFADLEGQAFLVVPHRLAPGFHDLIIRLCRRAGYLPEIIELATPDTREPLLAHLSRHADRVFVGPVSASTTSWEGVVHIPMREPDAEIGLSMVWSAGALTPAVLAAQEAAREVARREGWLTPAHDPAAAGPDSPARR